MVGPAGVGIDVKIHKGRSKKVVHSRILSGRGKPRDLSCAGIRKAIAQGGLGFWCVVPLQLADIPGKFV